MKNWQEVIISDVLVVNPKYSLSKGTIAKCVTMADLCEHTKKINNYYLKEYNGGSKFKNGDTLMARITPCLENGKTSFVDILNNNEVGFGSTEFIVLRGKQGRTLNEYVYYLAISPEIRQLAIKSMTGSSGRQRVPSDLFDRVTILLPPISEQRSIVEILKTLDDKIALNNQMNKTLEEIAEAIFKSWFIDFEPFQDGEFVDSELGRIPKGWGVTSLDSVADFLNGLAMQKHRPTSQEYLPVIKIRELKQGITTATEKARPDLDKRYIVENGDIIFSWSGSLELCTWCHGKGALNQHIFKVTSDYFPRWFYYYWIKHHLPNFQQIASGKATTMGHIQRKHLTEALVLVPSKTQLDRINEIISPIFQRVIDNKIESQTLTQLRDTLLPKLMSGEIRVTPEP